MLKRTPLNRGTKGLKRTAFKRGGSSSFKKKKGGMTEGEKTLWAEDLAFYQQIWEKRSHRCFETGEPLGSEPLTLYFHHLLEKESYPEFRHCEWNIVLVSWTTHDQVHLNIDKTPKIKQRREEVFEKYAAAHQTGAPGLLEGKAPGEPEPGAE